MSTAGLSEALTALRATLSETRLPLAVPSAEAARAASSHVATQLDDYVLPRLADIEAPLLVVVGGSTGAGKSTLVNSLVGRDVSRAGVLRPTTRSPVLVINPADDRWFSSDRVLGGLTRVASPSDAANRLQVVAEPSLPAGLAILDAPDIDSVVDSNRHLAAQLLDAADLWLFVTSAARYGDAVPWQFLADAAARSAVVAVVLDRVPDGARAVVTADLKTMMTARGLGQAPLFVIGEATCDGLLPNDAVAPVRSWLLGLASSAASRQSVAWRTLRGAIGALAQQASVVADAADEQVALSQLLESDAAAAYEQARQQVSAQAGDGSLLRGEVLAKWHDFVGTTPFVRLLDQKVSWVRDKIATWFGHAPGGDDVTGAAEAGLQVLISQAGEQAAGRAATAWRNLGAGRVLLDGRPDLARASVGFPDAVAVSMGAWQADIKALVAEEGAGKRQGARLAATGVNGVGAALMLVIFSSTGGLTGAELGIAGGTTLVAQKLLESIFGDEAVRRLANTAKANLTARIDGLLAAEQARFTAVVDGLRVASDAAARIDAAVDHVTTLVLQPTDAEASEATIMVPVPSDPEASEATAMVRLPNGLGES